MYKVTIIDKSIMEFDDIMITDKKSLKALMDFAWQPSKVDCVTTYNYKDIESINAYEVVATIFGENDDHTIVNIRVKDAFSAVELTHYFLSNTHFPGGDELCARPIGGEDE